MFVNTPRCNTYSFATISPQSATNHNLPVSFLHCTNCTFLFIFLSSSTKDMLICWHIHLLLLMRMYHYIIKLSNHHPHTTFPTYIFYEYNVFRMFGINSPRGVEDSACNETSLCSPAVDHGNRLTNNSFHVFLLISSYTDS